MNSSIDQDAELSYCLLMTKWQISLLFITLTLLGCQQSDIPEAPTPLPILFEDVTTSVGIDYMHFNGMSGEYYYCEMMGPGTALFDYDNDGDLDLFITQGLMLGPSKTMADALLPPPDDRPLRDVLYRNDLRKDDQGNPHFNFVDVTEESGIDSRGYGMGVAAGDIDNDGWIDLYVTNFGSNSLWRNMGDGTFKDITESSGTDDDRWSVSTGFVDYDQDGLLDLFVVNYTDFRWANRTPCYGPSGQIEYCGPLSHVPETDRLFRNLGNGRFENVTASAGVLVQGPGLGIVSADFDGDKKIDIYIANDQARNFLWMNQGDGTFSDEALLRGSALDCEGRAQASMGVVAGDIDGDGDEDLYMTHLLNEANTLYLNDGAGIFLDSTTSAGLAVPSKGLTGFGTAMMDINNDGWLDLLVANGAVRTIAAQRAAGDPLPLKQPNSVLLNHHGRFVDADDQAPCLAKALVSRSIAFGDLDNDGDSDVIFTNNNGPARVLLNVVGAERNWIGVRVVGPSGRDMLGTRVGLVRDGEMTLWRWARSDSGYLSSNDPRIIFGLGEETTIDDIVVQWPDGQEESWTGLPINRYHTLIQGSGGTLRQRAPNTADEYSPSPEKVHDIEARHLTRSDQLQPVPDPVELHSLDPIVRRQLLDRYDLLRRLLDDDKASDQGLAWAMGQLARVYHAYQKFEPARICYANARILNPREYRWAYLMGHIDRVEGRYPSSSAALQEALDLQPNHVPSMVWLAENELDQRRLVLAYSWFEKAIEVDKNCAKAHLGLARVELDQGDPSAALEHLETAFLLQPEASQVIYALGLAHRAMGDLGAAQQFFDLIPEKRQAKISIIMDDPLLQQVADLRDSAQIHSRMADKAIAQGRYRIAAQEFARAVVIDPSRTDTRYNLAAVLVRLGRNKQALQHLDILVSREPEHVLTRVLLARILAAKGQYVTAETHLEVALATDANSPGVHIAIADISLIQKKVKKAITHYQRAAAISPELEGAHTGLALAMIQRGNYTEGRGELEAYLALRPKSHKTTLFLARILAAAPDAELRDGARALSLISEILTARVNVSEAETLAMIHAELGNYDTALLWQSAVAKAVRDTDTAAGRRVQERLNLYRSRQPCRQPWLDTEKLSQVLVRRGLN